MSSPRQPNECDVVVVGAGIVGLAHALAAARQGLQVTVVERDHRCVGASIRNFGFITVTGQSAGDTWRRARRSRDVWAEVADAAAIKIEHRGLWVLAQRPHALAVLEAFVRTDMGAENELVDIDEAVARAPMLRSAGKAAMWSPHELRVESRTAIPRLAEWLHEHYGVKFVFGEAVTETEATTGRATVRTTARVLRAERVVICPGTELNGVGRNALSAYDLGLTRLQMLRVRPRPAVDFTAAVMGDLSLVRYGGYAALAEAAPLRAQLESEPETSACLANGIHLIVVQSADGTLVVGDSHDDSPTPEPFASEEVDRLILDQLRAVTNVDVFDVVERWIGVYPTGYTADCLVERPDPQTAVVVVTSGTGASTAFAIAEEVFANW